MYILLLMLDKKNTELLIETAQCDETPSATRVSACSLLYRLSAIPAKDIVNILQRTIDNPRTKSGIQVRAMDLIDKINNAAGVEPELRSEDVDNVKEKLREKYLVCPTNVT